MKTFITPIEEIFFSSSKIGVLCTGISNAGLSDSQKLELEKLELRKTTPKGISENQKKTVLKLTELDELDEKKQTELDRLIGLRDNPQGLTDNQKEIYDGLITKRDAPPELSDGAKTYVKEIWLKNEKKYDHSVQTKYTRKGLQGEEDAIMLVSEVDNFMYMKNVERIHLKNLTGECDINQLHEPIDKRIIDDIKCSWNPVTFMNASLTPLYKWQGISYMHLYNADIFRLRYCLVDCSPEVLEDEWHYFRYNNKLTEKHIIDNELLEQLKSGAVSENYPEVKKLVDQFYNNYQYADSGLYTKEERIKTFTVPRDEDEIKILLQAVQMAVEFYQTITLNMI